MNKQILLFCSIFIAFITHAQTGPRLLGALSIVGTNNSGTIIHYTGGDTTLTSVFDMPVSGFSSDPGAITLTETPNGELYGTISYYNSTTSLGAIYQYDYTNNAYTVKAILDSSTGFQPSDLLLANNGMLYGVAQSGGANNGGTIFSYTIGDTAVKKLFDFDHSAYPITSLIQASDGNLYGQTQTDGANGGGVIFQYKLSDSSYHILFSFPFHSYSIGGLVEVGADTLYGVTEYGGPGSGTLFRYTIGDVSDTILYNFPGGAWPQAKLLHASDGNLYGVTEGDGVNNEGTVFS
jgi:uncharacterized repeat protein (TIGR03803 family)